LQAWLDFAELFGQFQKPDLHSDDLLFLGHVVISVPPKVFRISRSMRSQSFSRRSQEISAAGFGAECGADVGMLDAAPARIPPSTPIAPIAQQRGCDAQFLCDLRHRPAAALTRGVTISGLNSSVN